MERANELTWHLGHAKWATQQNLCNMNYQNVIYKKKVGTFYQKKKESRYLEVLESSQVIYLYIYKEKIFVFPAFAIGPVESQL